MSEFCKCGNIATITPVLHAWKVNWETQTIDIKEYLKYDRICAVCKTKIVGEVRKMGVGETYTSKVSTGVDPV